MNFWVKTILFLLISMVIHYAGKMIPGFFLHFFLPTQESIFQHTKIIFYAYLIVNLIDWKYFKANVYKVIFIATIMTYPMMLIFYLPTSLFGAMEHFWSEFAWAIGATYLTGFVTLTIEKGIAVRGKMLEVVSVILFCIMIFLLARFTYVEPWVDYFQIPITNYK